MPDKVRQLNIPGLSDLTKAVKPGNFDLNKFEDVFFYFFKNCGTGDASVHDIGEKTPKLTIKQNLDLIEKEVDIKMPGYGSEFKVEGLGSGKAGWLVEAENRKPEDPVILFAHGGGYTLGLFPSFVYLFVEVYKRLSDDRLSVLLIDYTLMSDGAYPHQITDFTKVYNKLAESCKNIIIAGDSAGGHCCLTFMRHQNYKPYEEVLSAAPQKPSGAIILSPWVHLHPDESSGSYGKFEGKDVLSAPAVRGFAEALMPQGEWKRDDLNPYCDKIDWRSVIPKKILLTKGGSEVLVDDITTWGKLAKLKDDEVFENPDQVHDDSTFWPRTSAITEKIVDYMKSLE